MSWVHGLITEINNLLGKSPSCYLGKVKRCSSSVVQQATRQLHNTLSVVVHPSGLRYTPGLSCSLLGLPSSSRQFPCLLMQLHSITLRLAATHPTTASVRLACCLSQTLALTTKRLIRLPLCGLPSVSQDGSQSVHCIAISFKRRNSLVAFRTKSEWYI